MLGNKDYFSEYNNPYGSLSECCQMFGVFQHGMRASLEFSFPSRVSGCTGCTSSGCSSKQMTDMWRIHTCDIFIPSQGSWQRGL